MTNNFLNDEALGEVVGGVTRIVENDSVGYANIREEPGLNSKVFFTGAYDTGWIAGSLIGY